MAVAGIDFRNAGQDRAGEIERVRAVGVANRYVREPVCRDAFDRACRKSLHADRDTIRHGQNLVGSALTIEGVVTVTGAYEEGVIAFAAIQYVIVDLADEDVVSVAAVHGVMAVAGKNQVGLGGGHGQRFGRIGPDQHLVEGQEAVADGDALDDGFETIHREVQSASVHTGAGTRDHVVDLTDQGAVGSLGQCQRDPQRVGAIATTVDNMVARGLGYGHHIVAAGGVDDDAVDQLYITEVEIVDRIGSEYAHIGAAIGVNHLDTGQFLREVAGDIDAGAAMGRLDRVDAG